MSHLRSVDRGRETLRSSRLLRDAASQLRKVAEEMRRSNLDDEADSLSTTIRDLAWQCEVLLGGGTAPDSQRVMRAPAGVN